MMKDRMDKVLSGISVLVIFLVLFWALGHLDSYVQRSLSLWAINVIYAVAFNLVYGYTGQFSLAQSGLAALGAYTISLLMLSPASKEAMYMATPLIWPLNSIQWPFVTSFICAVIVTTVAGFFVGAPALRLRGDYLAVCTLAFAEIIRLLICNLQSVTNGPTGLKGIPRHTNLVWNWGLAILIIFIAKRLMDSSYGRAFKAIREDEIAAEAMGVNLFYHKLIAFVISSSFIGAGGALLAQMLSTITPDTFTLMSSTGVIMIVVLGGAASITGSVIAAGIYIIMLEVFTAIEKPWSIGAINIPPMPGLRMVAFSLMLLVLILFFRRGLLGSNEFSWSEVFRLFSKLFSKLKTICKRRKG